MSGPVGKPETGRSTRTPMEAPLELELEDTAAQRQRDVPVPQHRGSGGYDPYDAPAQPRQGQSRAQRTDLRKLSEWIRLRRTVEALQAAEAGPKDKPTRE